MARRPLVEAAPRQPAEQIYQRLPLLGRVLWLIRDKLGMRD